MLCVLLVNIRLLEADALGVRGGWKIWDFAPERRGAAGSRGWKLNAPGIAFGEFVIVLKTVRGSFGDVRDGGGHSGDVVI
jgi:hypothetical protein